MSRPGNDDFTVGIICALPFELTAVTSVLDETFDLPISSTYGTYTLGRMAGHNVVVACLPAGLYGFNLTTTITIDLLRKFPQVRLSLFVGIGSGVPSRIYDVRLGDVVVGMPRGTNSGVVQYGSSIFKSNVAMPKEVLSALYSGRGWLRSEGRKIGSELATVIARYPALHEEFTLPDPEHDRLFKSDYIHSSGYRNCDSCLARHEISRQKRDDPREPVVHYGQIASGNLVIKDAKFRDQLGSKLKRDPFDNIICFETEAVGITNILPALVIRGICDYADSHKNKSWQHYAALTAAVYTRTLLKYINSSKNIGRPLADILDLDLDWASESRGLGVVVTSDDISRGSSSSILVGQTDPTLLNIALEGIASSLCSEERFSSLCKAAISRMESSTLERHLAAFLIFLRNSMLKTDNSLRKDLAKVLRNNQFGVARSICERLDLVQKRLRKSSFI